MKFLLKVLKDFPSYILSGFGSIASIFLFLALWDFGYQVYGNLVLPSPKETFSVLLTFFDDKELLENILITIKRAMLGFGLAILIGSSLGLLAGMFVTASIMSRPIVTILFGMPPIAWIVLAMIWFGISDTTIVFTVFIASFPIVFVGALQGTRTIEGDLKQMVDSFHLPFYMKFLDLYLPHIFSYIFPAYISALGTSWKIVVMAELLASNSGIGSALAIARSQLDTSMALALVVVMIASLLLIEYLIFEPIKKELEQWRK